MVLRRQVVLNNHIVGMQLFVFSCAVFHSADGLTLYECFKSIYPSTDIEDNTWSTVSKVYCRRTLCGSLLAVLWHAQLWSFASKADNDSQNYRNTLAHLGRNLHIICMKCLVWFHGHNRKYMDLVGLARKQKQPKDLRDRGIFRLKFITWRRLQ